MSRASLLAHASGHRACLAPLKLRTRARLLRQGLLSIGSAGEFRPEGLQVRSNGLEDLSRDALHRTLMRAKSGHARESSDGFAARPPAFIRRALVDFIMHTEKHDDEYVIDFQLGYSISSVHK